jgi:hypothetical protein
VANAVTVEYTKGLRRVLSDDLGDVPVNYPLRISLGVQQQTFYDFTGKNRNTFLPVILVNLF